MYSNVFMLNGSLLCFGSEIFGSLIFFCRSSAPRTYTFKAVLSKEIRKQINATVEIHADVGGGRWEPIVNMKEVLVTTNYLYVLYFSLT